MTFSQAHILLLAAWWLLVQGNTVEPDTLSTIPIASWSFLVSGLSYANIMASPSTASMISTSVRGSASKLVGVPAEQVTVQFMPGSLIIRVSIASQNSDSLDVQKMVQLSDDIATSLAALSNIDSVSSGPISSRLCSDDVCKHMEIIPGAMDDTPATDAGEVPTIATGSMPENTGAALAEAAARVDADEFGALDDDTDELAADELGALDDGLWDQAVQAPRAAYSLFSLQGLAATIMVVAAMLALVAGAYSFQRQHTATLEAPEE